MTTYWCERAWLPPGRVAEQVVVEVDGGRIRALREQVPSTPPGAETLRGIVLPGLANAHSHAFHRALRGRTASGRGDFWTWREQMYTVAERLDPERYRALAEAVYAEMALAGITCVGEFHYLHHGPDGTPYADPNTMGLALVDAARAVGLRIALLDTCYLAAGFDAPPQGVQVRFSDGDAERWAQRVDALAAACAGADDVVVGAAVHSVRAVPAAQIPTVVAWAAARAAPLHVHLSEQRAENTACLAAHGISPTELLADAGALGPRTTAVHATHVGFDDVALLAASRTGVCACPTTERDLADGIGPFAQLVDAGVALSLGSDSHAVVDLFEEARAVELDQRLASQQRGHFPAAALLDAATRSGHAALGFPDAGRLEVGARADLVAVRLDSVRTAGTPPAEGVVFAATAADVSDVVAGGRRLVADGAPVDGVPVGARLARAIAEVLS